MVSYIKALGFMSLVISNPSWKPYFQSYFSYQQEAPRSKQKRQLFITIILIAITVSARDIASSHQYSSKPVFHQTSISSHQYLLSYLLEFRQLYSRPRTTPGCTSLIVILLLLLLPFHLVFPLIVLLILVAVLLREGGCM